MGSIAAGIEPSFIGAIALLSSLSVAVLIQLRAKAQRLRATAITEAKAISAERMWIDNDDFVRRHIEAQVRAGPSPVEATHFFENNFPTQFSDVSEAMQGRPSIARARHSELIRKVGLGLIPLLVLFVLAAWQIPGIQWTGSLLLGIVIAALALVGLAA